MTATFLVCDGTSGGQTATVAEHIVGTLADRGHEATTVDLAETTDAPDITDYDAVVVGSSIHVGKQQSSVTAFVSSARDGLSTVPAAFYQVSLSSAVDDEQRRAEAAGYAEEFLETVDWQPGRIGLFGGALRYSKYGFLKHLMMKRIAADATGDTDTSRDYEYTDWGEARAFTADFAAVAEQRLGVTPPAESDGGE